MRRSTPFARVIAGFNLRDDLTLEGSGGLFVGTSADTLGRLSRRDFFYARRYLHRVPDLMQQIMLELDDVGEHITRMNKRLDEYTAYTTTTADRIRVCDAAIAARWGTGKEVDEGFKAMLRAKLLAPRRNEDRSDTLYKVMNVVQENTLRGGQHYVSNNRMNSIRPIAAVDRNVKINQAIWTAADEILLAA